MPVNWAHTWRAQKELAHHNLGDYSSTANKKYMPRPAVHSLQCKCKNLFAVGSWFMHIASTLAYQSKYEDKGSVFHHFIVSFSRLYYTDDLITRNKRRQFIT